MKVYYLGPKGTFSEEAALYFARQLDIPESDIVQVETIAQVIERVYQEGRENTNSTALGCVPLENSIQGSVTMAWDTLGRICREEQSKAPMLENVWQVGLSPTIVASVTLSIEHFLLTLPGTDVTAIEEILSHPQGLAQCTDWLRENLPSARQTAVSSTADAARIVAGEGNSHKAAIGPQAAGRLYQLNRSLKSIQNSSINQTRFGLIALNSSKPDVMKWFPRKHWTLSIVLTGVANAPGGLYQSLHPFHKQGFNLTRIESRPSGSQLGEYLFYLDVEWPYGNQRPEETAAWIEVREELAESSIQVVRLGWFPELVRQ